MSTLACVERPTAEPGEESEEEVHVEAEDLKMQRGDMNRMKACFTFLHMEQFLPRDPRRTCSKRDRRNGAGGNGQ